MTKEDLGVILAALTIAVMAVLIIFMAIIVPIQAYQCYQYEKVTGRETNFVVPDSCYVKAEDGTWLSKREYLSTLMAREALR